MSSIITITDLFNNSFSNFCNINLLLGPNDVHHTIGSSIQHDLSSCIVHSVTISRTFILYDPL